mgnify:CR=1 FL=1
MKSGVRPAGGAAAARRGAIVRAAAELRRAMKGLLPCSTQQRRCSPCAARAGFETGRRTQDLRVLAPLASSSWYVIGVQPSSVTLWKMVRNACGIELNVDIRS